MTTSGVNHELCAKLETEEVNELLSCNKMRLTAFTFSFEMMTSIRRLLMVGLITASGSGASETGESDKVQAVLKAFPIAYQTLARATSLPDEAIDTTGRTLPKAFVAYLVDEKSGRGQFVRGLSADNIEAFKTWGQAVGVLGAIRYIEFVANNGMNEKPSAFDFVQYSSMREFIYEYPPAINGVAQADVAQNWKLISQSRNPVYRLLAINVVQRVIKDQVTVVALLDSRTGEVDSTIVHALIAQLAIVGGDSGKASLTKIAINATSRGDQAILKAATEAISKLN